MNTAGDAAEQIVRMSLNGVEVAAKITGAGAKELAMMIYAIAKDQKKTKGKIRLSNIGVGSGRFPKRPDPGGEAHRGCKRPFAEGHRCPKEKTRQEQP